MDVTSTLEVSVTVSFLVIMFHIVLVVLLIRVIVTVCSGLGAAVDVILGVLVGVMVGIMVGVDSVSDLVVKGMDCGSSEIVSGPEFVIIGVVPTGSEADVVAIVGSSSSVVSIVTDGRIEVAAIGVTTLLVIVVASESSKDSVPVF